MPSGAVKVDALFQKDKPAFSCEPFRVCDFMLIFTTSPYELVRGSVLVVVLSQVTDVEAVAEPLWQAGSAWPSLLELCAYKIWPSLWPCHPERARSRLISEAKQSRAWLLLGWETT